MNDAVVFVSRQQLNFSVVCALVCLLLKRGSENSSKISIKDHNIQAHCYVVNAYGTRAELHLCAMMLLT